MELEGKIKVIVKPNSAKNEILEYDEEKKAYKVAIKAAPEKGKANMELIKFFKKLTKKEVEIISGSRSRKKVLLLKKQKL